MNTAIIEVAFANRPPEGKKLGTIKTQEGEIYGVWPRELGLYQPGRIYEIEFEERKWNGKTYRTIKKGKPKEDSLARPSPSPESPRGALNAEQEFVSRLLAASIQACAVTYSDQGLIAAAKMLRKVFREAMG